MLQWDHGNMVKLCETTLQKCHSLSLSHFQQVRGGGTQKSGVSRGFPSLWQHDDFGCWLLFGWEGTTIREDGIRFLTEELSHFAVWRPEEVEVLRRYEYYIAVYNISDCDDITIHIITPHAKYNIVHETRCFGGTNGNRIALGTSAVLCCPQQHNTGGKRKRSLRKLRRWQSMGVVVILAAGMDLCAI